jgi:hypothetical protein
MSGKGIARQWAKAAAKRAAKEKLSVKPGVRDAQARIERSAAETQQDLELLSMSDTWAPQVQRWSAVIITILQDKRPQEFFLPQSFVGRVIQLAFDRKKVAGNGEPPGLHGILVYGHEPDAEFDIQGGREGHKKSNT